MVAAASVQSAAMGIDYFALPFRPDDPELVVDHMREMLRLADGRRWINIRPDLPDDVMAALDRKPSIFSGRGPRIPTATWVPSSFNRKGERVPTQAGLTHPQGHDAKMKLSAAGVETPDGWVVEQDHPKRGFTYLIPDDDDPTVAIEFLVAAADAVSGVHSDGKWVAIVAVA